jgi:hypothetical protein
MPSDRARFSPGFTAFRPTGFAEKYRGPLFDAEGGGGDVALQTKITNLTARVAELNAENATRRLAEKTSNAALEAANADVATLRAKLEKAEPLAAEAPGLREKLAAAETAKTAAEAKIADADKALKENRLSSSLQVAAIAAGIVDKDALKLLDVAALELDADGTPKDATGAIEKFKAEKPWAFGASGIPPAPPRTTTANPKTPPKAPDQTPKHASEMTADEYKAARALIDKR